MHCKTRENSPFSGLFFNFRVVLTSGGYLLKITLKDSLGGTEFATTIARRYGEFWEMLISLEKGGRKTVQKVKNYGGGKMPRIQTPYYFEYPQGPSLEKNQDRPWD